LAERDTGQKLELASRCDDSGTTGVYWGGGISEATGRVSPHLGSSLEVCQGVATFSKFCFFSLLVPDRSFQETHTRSTPPLFQTKPHSGTTTKMRTTFFLAAATALTLAEAANNMLTPYGGIYKRQAFDPDETTGSGANCIEAFGEGYIECVPKTDTTPRLCINPALGETCCNNLCMSSRKHDIQSTPNLTNTLS